MDEEALELEKERIDEELRRIRRSTKKAQKDDEDRALIAAGEGRVNLTMKGPRKAKEKAKKDASENFRVFKLITCC